MPIELTSDDLAVMLTPERGADITRLTDTHTGIQVLAESPTARVTNSNAAWSDSHAHWMNGYPGGWQLLVPNAGPERSWDGVTQGFHGEASLASWTVLARDPSGCELETFLLTAPLHIRRVVTVEGLRLTVSDTVTNLAPRPTQFRLCQHPAFGHHFLDSSSFLETTAGRFIADAERPGSFASANQTGSPTDVLPRGPRDNTVLLPGPGSEKDLFGALTEFLPDAGTDAMTSVTFVSPTKKLSATVSWDYTVFPYAWMWIEANSMPTWPWFQRMYSIAVEPANVLPGSGPGPAGYERGGPGTTLAGGASLTAEVTITLSHHTDQ